MKNKIKSYLSSNRVSIAFFTLIFVLFCGWVSYSYFSTNDYYQELQKEYESQMQSVVSETQSLKKELKNSEKKYVTLKMKYQKTQKVIKEQKDKIEALQQDAVGHTDSPQDKKDESAAMSTDNVTLTGVKQQGSFIGDFTITYYCGENYPHICGAGTGITASGAIATAGVTIAADPNVLPIGTTVYIEGIGERTVQDTGGAVVGNRIDVFVNTHSEALEKGMHTAKVYRV